MHSTLWAEVTGDSSVFREPLGGAQPACRRHLAETGVGVGNLPQFPPGCRGACCQRRFCLGCGWFLWRRLLAVAQRTFSVLPILMAVLFPPCTSGGQTWATQGSQAVAPPPHSGPTKLVSRRYLPKILTEPSGPAQPRGGDRAHPFVPLR